MQFIAGTGHRPDKLGGYSPHTHRALISLAMTALSTTEPCELVISGMAQGWDQALASAALELAIPFDAYIPFLGQESRWPPQAQETYKNLIEQAHHVVICSDGAYSPFKMQIRNERMVDACSRLLACWNGSPGGTANCIRYAEQVHKPITNAWPLVKEALHL